MSSNSARLLVFGKLLLLALVIQNLVFAQDSSRGLPHSLLWQIEGKGLKHPSYVFGTMHVLCAGDAVLSNALKTVIAGCDQVYFEIDMSDMMAMMEAMKYMPMNGNVKLSDLLSPEDFQKVKNYFDTHASLIPFSVLEKFKPMLLSSLMEEEELPCKNTNGMEFVILQEARSKSRKIAGLETAAFQASLFDSIPYHDQAVELVRYLDSISAYRQLTDTLVAAYKAADLDKIEQLTASETGISARFMDLLLYRRNRKWIEQLKSQLSEKSLLIAVGAGHLPGDQGLLNLLRKNGYIVKPVNAVAGQ